MHSPLCEKANAPIHFLREGTYAGHAAMEQTPLARDLMSDDVSVDRYVEILATWFGAWAVLEDRIGTSAFAPSVAALLPSRRAHLGHDDLQYWAAQGITFFAPGSAPALTWPQWTPALNSRLETPAAVARAVVSADATFAVLHRAFSCASITACGLKIKSA